MIKEDKSGTMKNIKPNYGAITGGYSAPVIPTPVVANYGSVTGGSAVVEGGETPTPTTYGAILSQLEQARQGARDQARSTYDQATIGANAQHDRAKSNYGMTADALVRSGLANSGYSNNIDAAAYAARARQLEGAQSNYGQALLNADKAYNEGVVAAEMGRQAKYEDILKAIGAGTMTPAQGAQIGKDYGLTPEQQAGVDKTVTQAQNDSYAYYVNQLGSGGYVDFATVDADTYLSDDQRTDIKKRSLANIATAFASGDSANFASILNTLDANKGNMDETAYQNAYKAYGERLVKDALDEDALKAAGEDPIDYNGQIRETLAKLRSEGKLSKPAYDELIEKLGLKLKITQGFWQNFSDDEKVNFEIGGKKYGIKLFKDETFNPPEHRNAADGTIVEGAHGQYYARWHNKWHLIGQDNKYSDDFASVMSIIKDLATK